MATRGSVVTAALIAVALLGACSSTTSSPVAPAAAASPAPSASASARTSGATLGASAAPTPSPLDRTATPARTSGSLGPRSMPPAAVLGPGWTSRVDPGSAEDGYTGNGTSVVARDVRDVRDALLPLGCADPRVYAARMPLPQHALEADYAYRPTGVHAVGLVLDYGDAVSAQRFVRLYTSALRRCTSGAGGSMVVRIEAVPGDGLFASTQTDRLSQETWRELVAPAGAVVRLIAVEGDRTPLRPWAAIARDLPPAS